MGRETSRIAVIMPGTSSRNTGATTDHRRADRIRHVHSGLAPDSPGLGGPGEGGRDDDQADKRGEEWTDLDHVG